MNQFNNIWDANTNDFNPIYVGLFQCRGGKGSEIAQL